MTVKGPLSGSELYPKLFCCSSSLSFSKLHFLFICTINLSQNILFKRGCTSKIMSFFSAKQSTYHRWLMSSFFPATWAMEFLPPGHLVFTVISCYYMSCYKFRGEVTVIFCQTVCSWLFRPYGCAVCFHFVGMLANLVFHYTFFALSLRRQFCPRLEKPNIVSCGWIEGRFSVDVYSCMHSSHRWL